jgi:YHS domain-containing protein
MLGCSGTPEAEPDALEFFNADAGSINVDSDGVAAGGYDLVSYHAAGQAEQGSDSFAADFEGHRYLFASEENRDTFLSDPPRYLPEFGGFCAFGVGMTRGSGLGDNPPGKYPVDPQSFKVIDEKLYLFYDGPQFDALEEWNQDEEALLERANATWERIGDIGS